MPPRSTVPPWNVVAGLHQVAQRAVELERAITFYRDILAVRFIARFDPPGLAFFDLGGTRLLLEGGDTMTSGGPSPRVGVDEGSRCPVRWPDNLAAPLLPLHGQDAVANLQPTLGSSRNRP